MVLIQTKQTDYEVIPEGTYDGKFKGVDEKSNEKGSYYLWRFDVVGRSGRAAEVVGNSPLSFGPRAKAFKWAGALRGREYTPGEPIEIDALIGKPCKVVVLKEPRNDGNGDRNVIAAVLPVGGGGAPDNGDEPF